MEARSIELKYGSVWNLIPGLLLMALGFYTLISVYNLWLYANTPLQHILFIPLFAFAIPFLAAGFFIAFERRRVVIDLDRQTVTMHNSVLFTTKNEDYALPSFNAATATTKSRKGRFGYHTVWYVMLLGTQHDVELEAGSRQKAAEMLDRVCAFTGLGRK